MVGGLEAFTSRVSMPASAVPIAARSYEAFARGDMDAVLADMHPDIEWHQAQDSPTEASIAGSTRFVARSSTLSIGAGGTSSS